MRLERPQYKLRISKLKYITKGHIAMQTVLTLCVVCYEESSNLLVIILSAVS